MPEPLLVNDQRGVDVCGVLIARAARLIVPGVQGPRSCTSTAAARLSVSSSAGADQPLLAWKNANTSGGAGQSAGDRAGLELAAGSAGEREERAVQRGGRRAEDVEIAAVELPRSQLVDRRRLVHGDERTPAPDRRKVRHRKLTRTRERRKLSWRCGR